MPLSNYFIFLDSVNRPVFVICVYAYSEVGIEFFNIICVYFKHQRANFIRGRWGI